MSRLLDQVALGSQQAQKPLIESAMPLTEGIVNAFSPRWISSGAVVELLNCNGKDPTRPTKRDGYKQIRQTILGISSALQSKRAAGLGYLSPSSGTKLLVMAIPNAGAGGIFFTPDPDLTPWSQAGVGGAVIATTYITFYWNSTLANAAPTGIGSTVNFAGPGGTDNFKDTLTTVTSARVDVASAVGSGAGPKVAVAISAAGTPGLAQWPAGTHSLVITFPAGSTFTAGTAANWRVQAAVVRFSSANANIENGAFSAYQNVVDGTLTFACPAPVGGWAAGSTTDRLGYVLSFEKNDAGSGFFSIECNDGASYGVSTFTTETNNSVAWDPLADDVKMFQANNRLWILPAKEIALAVMDNTAALTLSGAANEDAPTGIVDGAYFLNRVWLMDKNNKLFWSTPLPMTPIGTFDQAVNSLTFSPNRGSKAVAIKPWRNTSLLIAFNDSIEEFLIDPIDILGSARNLIEPDFGCCARDAFIGVGDDFYFVDQYGQVRSLKQTEQQKIAGAVKEPLSQAIRAEIPGRVNMAFAHRIRLHTELDELHVFFPRDSSEQANYRAVYSFTYEKWVSLDSLADSTGKVLRSDIRGRWETFLLDGDTASPIPLAYITNQGTYADNAVAIGYREETKAFVFDQAEAAKVARWAELEYYGSIGAVPTVEARINETGSWTTLTRMAGDTQVGTSDVSVFPLLPGSFPLLPGSFPLVTTPGTASFARTRYRLDSDVMGRCRSIQLRISESGNGLQFQRIAWHLVAEPKVTEPVNG